MQWKQNQMAVYAELGSAGFLSKLNFYWTNTKLSSLMVFNEKKKEKLIPG